jgi:hypothetical protein
MVRERSAEMDWTRKASVLFALPLPSLLLVAVLGARPAMAETSDVPTYHGGVVVSPNLACLLWSPNDATGFTQTDAEAISAYLTDVANYLSNDSTPAMGDGAGVEPTLRQYGVWGASFPGTCTIDHTDPGGPLSMKPSDGLDRIKAEVALVQQKQGFQPYAPQNLNVVFTKGWAYDADQPGCATHLAVGIGSYLTINPIGDVCPTASSIGDYTAREIFDAITDPDGVSWHTNPTNLACAAGGVDVSDDGIALPVMFPGPGPNGFALISSSDDNTARIYGDSDNCGPTAKGTIFSPMTTTPPVTVIQTRNAINVLARGSSSPSGFVHLVSNNSGASYTAVASPIGNATELPTGWSKDGISIDMFGRGLDGQMYRWSYDGDVWSARNGVGGYAIGPASAAYANGEALFVTQNDGWVWLYGYGAWYLYGQGTPSAIQALSPPQAFLRNASCLDLYVTGLDGHVHRNACATGSWQQVPGDGFGLLTAVNRPTETRVDVFTKAPIGPGGSQTFWARYNDGDLVASAPLDAIPQSVGPVAAVEVGSAHAIWLLFTRDNRIYLAESDATGTSYVDWGVVESPTVTGPPTAYAPDRNTVLAYARRQSDGHLIQLRWLNGILQATQDLGVEIL